ncbi:MAG: thiamine pyrophosphate-dependent dehydrogenase E1 component subunit alpha [Bacteroidetes bacterium]|nr:thiamine pyrophosphate-dependent dehydrogenase E1 component subunit alpha [Bacteroidota bacterium]
MRLIRETEERILELFSQGKLRGTTHTCIGQEANAAGIIGHLGSNDIIFSNHRCHGHYLAYTRDVDGLIAELMGKRTGVCGGLSGSQHLCSGNFYSNGVQGGIVPNAVGMAFAERLKGSGSIATVFLGDGTLGEGVVYESMNIASLWRAPVLFVVEHNGYAQSTPAHLQIAGSVAARPLAFGIDTMEIESTDVEVISAAAGAAVGAVRGEMRPACLIVNTYRFSPHSKGDDHRDPAEIEERRRRDPLLYAEARLEAEVVERIGAECRAAVDAAVARALEADRQPREAAGSWQ